MEERVKEEQFLWSTSCSGTNCASRVSQRMKNKETCQLTVNCHGLRGEMSHDLSNCQFTFEEKLCQGHFLILKYFLAEPPLSFPFFLSPFIHTRVINYLSLTADFEMSLGQLVHKAYYNHPEFPIKSHDHGRQTVTKTILH